MLDQANRTFMCSVVFVDLVGYTKKTVPDQIRLKTSLTSNLSEGIKDVPVDQRIILDTGDGAAVSFLGDPEDALFLTLSLREAMQRDRTTAQEDQGGAEAEVRMGINLGPVRLLKDINGHPNMVGDGINVAQRIMSFARPGQIAVSRSYYEMVSNLASEYAKLFQYEGSHTDKHVRDHELYIVGYDEGALRIARQGMKDRITSTNPNRAQPDAATSSGSFTLTLPIPALPRDKKTLSAIAGTLAVVVLVLGLLVALKKPVPPVAPASALAGAAEGQRLKRPAAEGASPARAEASIAPPAKVFFAIAPWGKVFVNGKQVGVSPPLKSLQLAPGLYRIEVTNTGAPPYVETIEVKSRDAVTIQHTFR
jgi:class 3 adenylate cyclase